MKQIFVCGASSPYGVGGFEAGWGDLIKQYCHRQLFGDVRVEENYEVYNLAKSGSTLEFVEAVCGQVVDLFRKDGVETIGVVALGANDARAVETEDNFVTTEQQFRGDIEAVLTTCKETFDHVVVVASGYVDESLTYPKPPSWSGGKASYHSNERRAEFNNIIADVCGDMELDFVPFDIDQAEWTRNCLFDDGLHPNQRGHQAVFDLILPILQRHL